MFLKLQTISQAKFLIFSLLVGLMWTDSQGTQRTTEGIIAIYDFSEANGAMVKDRSGMSPALDLKIENTQAVSRTRGTLQIHGETQIRSLKPATKIHNAILRSGEITLEAWFHPANTKQSGPARIVTLSKNSSERNFTLGQDGNRIDARLRTTKSSANGMPSTSSPKNSLKAELTHVVYTRTRSGETRIYLNSKQVVRGTLGGEPSNWDNSLRLGLANENSNDRPWKGTYHLIAIYERAISDAEVQENFDAGAGAGNEAILARIKTEKNLRSFHQEIAPLLVKHCLECHDAGTRKGKLDLSHKASALAGGKNGKVIIPGKGSESILWQAIAEDEMPEDREPLSASEKEAIKKWIDSGAVWPIDFIDPVAYKGNNSPGKVFVRRLTVPEYINTVRATVGVDISKQATSILPADLRADGFSNTAYNLGVDLKHIESYSTLAASIVEKMNIRNFAARFSKNRNLTQKPMRKHISLIGKWILRGPLGDHEIDSYRGISTTVAATGGAFDDAIRYIVEAMLQSPRFIYIMEEQRGNGRTVRVSDYELASRASYIIWGASPDQDLMLAVERNELRDQRKLAVQVRRMLEDPRARARSERFAYEWLHLERLKHLTPEEKRFPNWDHRLAEDMAAETLAFFNEIVWEKKRPLADLLNAQFTYATARLAKHYRFVSDDSNLSVKGTENSSNQSVLTRYDLSKVPSRGGLLTHGSILTIGGDEASMVTRGLFILHNLLRGTISDPPPGTDTTPVPSKPGHSQRSIAEKRINDKACGGCHSKFEPLAFGLERYDGLGSFSKTDTFGNPLRDDGQLLIPGIADSIAYQSSAELMNTLATNDRVLETITSKLTQFALGRPLNGSDIPALKIIHNQSLQNGGKYTDTITAIILNDLVLMAQTETDKTAKIK